MMAATALASPSTGPSLGEMKGRMALALDLVPGLDEGDRRVGRLMLRNTSRDTFAASGELVTWVGSNTLAEAIFFSEEGKRKLKSVLRAVKRARAKLVELGIVQEVERGGHGQGNTTRFRFAQAVLAAFEDRASRAGVLQKFGGQDDAGGRSVTLAAPHQSDGDATLSRQGDGRTKGDGAGRAGVFGVQSAAPVTLDANAVRQSDGGATLSGATPVDKSLIPVDIPTGDAGESGVRVTAARSQSDGDPSPRVTGAPPEPLSNQNQPARVRGAVRPPDRRQRDLPLMRTMRGGLDGAVDAAQGAARVRREARADRRHDAVLQRASALLGGDARTSSLAVSTLPADAIERMRRGWTPTDDEFQALIIDSLAALDAAGLGVPAPRDGDGVAALRQDMRALQEQVGTLARLVETVLRVGGGGLAAVG